MSLEITEELLAQQPPESQAIIRMLLVKIAELEARLNKTPKKLIQTAVIRTSPRETRAAAKAKIKTQTWGPAGT